MASESSVLDGISAPAEYLVLDSPNAFENGSYACPHHGCDGMSFDTTLDAIIHDTEWHAPPYKCPECSTSFAAQPALTRHALASGHSESWPCREPRCPDHGKLFANRTDLHCHVVGSLAHQRVRESRYNTRGSRVMYNESNKENIPEDTDEEEYECEEPCCFKFQKVFRSKDEWSRHEKSYAHTSAITLDQTLREKDLAEELLENTRQAARSYTCASSICPAFGKQLSTPQSFYRHITTSVHLQGPPPKAPPKQLSLPKQPKEPRQLAPRQCTVHACTKYLHVFSSVKNYHRHIQSEAHLLASSSRFTTPARDEDGLVFFGGLVSPVTPTFFKMPVAREAGARRIVTDYDSDEDEDNSGKSEDNSERSPDSSPNSNDEKAVALAELEQQNAELKQRIAQLESELATLKADPSPTYEQKKLEVIVLDE